MNEYQILASEKRDMVIGKSLEENRLLRDQLSYYKSIKYP
jgi:hypothetical protein